MNPDLFDRADSSERRRALLLIGGIAVLVVLLLVGLAVFLLGLGGDEPAAPGTTGQAPAAGAPPAGPDLSTDGNWDVEAQTALATQPMLELAESAALPHALTDEVAGPPITLPGPGESSGTAVPQGFPDTEEGAVAQLVEMTRVGLEGGDPDGYRLAYEQVAAPGAPPVDSTRLYRDLQQVRAGTGLPRSGAVAGLVFTWNPTSALVKGSTDGGRYVVVCVLGELITGRNGQSLSTAAGNCQAMRRIDDQWRISPGAAAAPATLAWPGTAEAVQAGYRDLIR